MNGIRMINKKAKDIHCKKKTMISLAYFNAKKEDEINMRHDRLGLFRTNELKLWIF